MFGMGPMELTIVLVIVLVLFGAKRVPEIGASLGKGIREFKRSISDVDQEVVTYRSGIEFVELSERVFEVVADFIDAIKTGRRAG